MTSRAAAGFPSRLSVIVGDQVVVASAFGAGLTSARIPSVAWEADEQASATAATGSKDLHMPVIHRSCLEGCACRPPPRFGCRTVDGVELVSERLALRPASERDLDFYYEMRNRPEILARPGVESRPRTDIERQLRGWIDRWQEYGFGTWTVFERESGERQGRVELDPIGPGWEGISPGEIEVGAVVHPTRWNRGIATEAAGLVVADCFTRAGLSRLIALTTTDNEASLRALEKLGMRQCGQTRHEGDAVMYEVFELIRSAPDP